MESILKPNQRIIIQDVVDHSNREVQIVETGGLFPWRIQLTDGVNCTVLNLSSSEMDELVGELIDIKPDRLAEFVEDAERDAVDDACSYCERIDPDYIHEAIGDEYIEKEEAREFLRGLIKYIHDNVCFFHG